MTKTRVYAIAGGKGGVGKTTTAVALSACAAAAGEATVLVDADIGMGDVASFLDLDVTDATLHDVLAGEASVADAVREGPAGFDVLPAGASLDGYAAADPAALRDVVAALREEYDVVMLDAGGGLSHDTVVPLGVADGVVLVSTPDAVALANTEKTRQVVDRVGGDVRGLVLTRADDPGDAAADVDVPLLGAVPTDDAVQEAAVAGDALPRHAPDGPATGAYCDVAASLFEVPVTDMELGGADEFDPGAIPFADSTPRSDETAPNEAAGPADSDPAPANAEDAPTIPDAEAQAAEAETGTDATTEAEADAAAGETEAAARGEADAEEAETGSGMLSRISGLLK